MPPEDCRCRADRGSAAPRASARGPRDSAPSGGATYTRTSLFIRTPRPPPHLRRRAPPAAPRRVRAASRRLATGSATSLADDPSRARRGCAIRAPARTGYARRPASRIAARCGRARSSSAVERRRTAEQCIRGAADGALSRGPRARLAELQIPGQLYIMQSSGGIAIAPVARRLPIRLVESGPAAGALAAAQAARERGERKAALVRHGRHDRQACVIDEGRAAGRPRVRGGRAPTAQEGLGLPGACGDRDDRDRPPAAADRARRSDGLLKVGPTAPGPTRAPPATPRRRQPTVTDADLLSAIWTPSSSWAGACASTARRRSARSRRTWPGRSVDVTEAAWGIHRVVNETWRPPRAIHGIERARIFRSYPSSPSAAPARPRWQSRPSEDARILLPLRRGAMSAYGLLAAPLAFDFVRTGRQRLDAAELGRH